MHDPIAAAILRTLNYADLFDYAMTPEEVLRFLIETPASRAEIVSALDDPQRLNGSVARVEGFLTLPHRPQLVAARARLHVLAQRQFPRARFYARLLAHLPFVRMIAITGGLAMENARDDDMDYLIVTAPGRLWLVRGMTVALVRLARFFGDQLCPNFLLTENALAIPDQNLYTAHEIVQMIPLYGLDVYRRMRVVNRWTEQFLPNANGVDATPSEPRRNRIGHWLKRAAERALAGAIGDRIEQWEMRRKIAKLAAQIPASADTVLFSPDTCRGFFSGHRSRTLKEYELRMTND
ncbi:MAG: hypothetical protein HY782_07385 [Chloroflexi bacterium]|nr:hypothetical protein [Chloroflexota bacterium]